MTLYNPDHVADYYDKFGEPDPFSRESVYMRSYFEVHNHFLKSYISPKQRVLELGCGVGEFTVFLAELGASIVATDISLRQIERNQQNVSERSPGAQVEQWKQIDICDLSAFSNESFDHVVCYGGPLSYVFEKTETALKEIHRVLKPGGTAFIGVMNLWGVINAISRHVFKLPEEGLQKVIATGNIHPTTFTPPNYSHQHLFTPRELKALLAQTFEVKHIASSNFLSLALTEQFQDLLKIPSNWKRFLDLEIEACSQEGNQGLGQQLIAVVRK